MEEIRTFTTRTAEEIMIRPAEPEDSCEIIDTIRSNARERSYVLMEQYGKGIASEVDFIRTLDRLRNLLIVAAAGVEVVGCLAGFPADDDEREKTAGVLHMGLHLREEFRGKGIGTQMLSYAIDWARERGFKKVRATIFTPDSRSIKLFSNAGFTEEGTRSHKIMIGSECVDKVVMTKSLE
jgi:RimJ/RimL family protein N-acetyltransferase